MEAMQLASGARQSIMRARGVCNLIKVTCMAMVPLIHHVSPMEKPNVQPRLHDSCPDCILHGQGNGDIDITILGSKVCIAMWLISSPFAVVWYEARSNAV